MALQKQILNSKLIIILLLLAFFPPAYLSRNAIIDFTLKVLKLAGFIVIFAFFMFDIKKHLKKTFNILLIVLWAELLLSTLLSDNASLYTYLTTATTVLGSCFMIEEIALHSPMKGLKSMYLYFSAIVLINTLTVFLFPGGMYANINGLMVCWLLGEDNVGYSFYIAASAIAMMYSRYISKRITCLTVLVWMSSFLFVFHNDIATGIVSQIVWLLIVIGYRFDWFRKLVNARTCLYITVGGFLLLVVTRRLIVEPITSALNRSVTFSGRTIIWDCILESLKSRPLMGFGVIYGEREFRNVISLPTYFRGISSAHNLTLQIFFWGGLLGLFLFVAIIWCANQNNEMIRQSIVYRCCAIAMIVFSVRFLMEQGNHFIFFMFLALLANCKEFESNMKVQAVPTRIAKYHQRSIMRIRLPLIRR